MNNKKALSLAIATFVLCGSTTLFSNTAKAEQPATDNAIVDTIVTPYVQGIFKVTAVSGANLRSDAGTSYSIVGTAYYGEECAYTNISKKDTSGVTWYKVVKQDGSVTGWIISTVGVLS